MLQNVIPYKSALIAYSGRDGFSPSDRLTELDFDYAECFSKFLKPFYDATEQLSGVYYSTSIKAMHQLVAISKKFTVFGQYEFFESIIGRMKEKFLKYWDGVPLLYCIAICLDPRGKIKFCTRSIELIAGNLEIPAKPTRLQVETALHNLYSMYNSRLGNAVGASSSSSAPATQNVIRDEFSQLDDDDVDAFDSGGRTELDAYLQDNHSYIRMECARKNIEFDVLEWWKSQAGRYPILSIMARDILSTPVSSVACEQVFSISGNVLDERRSRLKADILEATMCVMDWERARLRSQENQELWIEDFAGMSVTDD